MKISALYRYKDESGTVVSPHRPPEGVKYDMRYRLFADEGKILVKGFTAASVIDCADPEEWTEEEEHSE